MDSIKLRNKRTGKVADYDISISSVGPQIIDISIVGGGGRGWYSFEEIANEYEIVPIEELKEDK